MAQVANTLPTWTDWLKTWNKYGYVIPPVPDKFDDKYYDKTLKKFVDPYHTVRKQIRSLVRTFSEYIEISPLTFVTNNDWNWGKCTYEGKGDKKPPASCYSPCTDANMANCYESCVKKGIDQVDCMINYLPHNLPIFTQIVYDSNNAVKNVVGGNYDAMRALVDTAFLYNKKGCDNTKTCNYKDDQCDWKNCDLVEWFGALHNQMVEFLGYAKTEDAFNQNRATMVVMADYLNKKTGELMVRLNSTLVPDLLYIMRSTYGYKNACGSKVGKKIMKDIKKLLSNEDKKKYENLLTC
jgi:hypothetical protein